MNRGRLLNLGSVDEVHLDKVPEQHRKDVEKALSYDTIPVLVATSDDRLELEVD